MKKYGILLIGCGYIGCEHLKDIYYRPEFEMVGKVPENGLEAELDVTPSTITGIKTPTTAETVIA